MRKSISARRIPRKIGEDSDENETPHSASADTSSLESAVKRPSSKVRKSLTLRNSLGSPGDDIQDELDGPSVITPKRSHSSKVAIQRSAAKRTSNLASQIPLRNLEGDDDRPNYSAASLQELRDNTPSLPHDPVKPDPDTGSLAPTSDTGTLDLASKFGTSLARYQQSSIIPSAAEIAEKKARRARLALEEKADEYISLNPSDPELDDLDDNVTKDEYGRLILKPKDKYGLAETRLVRDDEDIMENFDEFTEDGKISLGQKAEAEAAKRRKQEMAAQIAAAEGASDSDSDASERERKNAFEAAQTKHGTYAQPSSHSDPVEFRARTPPIISPLPTLDGVLERLRAQISTIQEARMKKVQEMEMLKREKIQLVEEEVRIQKALDETAEKFKRLRSEKGITDNSDVTVALRGPVPAGEPDDSISGDASPMEVQNTASYEVGKGVGFAGLGFAGARGGLGLGMATDQESDSDDY